MAESVFDVIIVGGGPCGLACGIEASKAGLNYIILEKGSITESIRRYPKQMTFFSTSDNISIGDVPFPTVGPKANRTEALQYYRKVVDYFSLNISLYTEVCDIREDGDLKVIKDQNGKIYKAKSLIIATGYFDKPRVLGVEGEGLPHVSHYYDEAFQYVNTNVAVIGGGNSAVEAALDLYRHGAKVCMLLRGDSLKTTAKYWLLPDLRNRIHEGNIQISYQCSIQRITPNEVIVENKRTQQEFAVPADFVLSLIGYVPNVKLFEMADIDYDKEDLVPYYNPKTYETNKAGVYLAGTVISGCHTERVFIENGRLHAEPIITDIAEKVTA